MAARQGLQLLFQKSLASEFLVFGDGRAIDAVGDAIEPAHVFLRQRLGGCSGCHADAAQGQRQEDAVGDAFGFNVIFPWRDGVSLVDISTSSDSNMKRIAARVRAAENRVRRRTRQRHTAWFMLCAVACKLRRHSGCSDCKSI